MKSATVGSSRHQRCLGAIAGKPVDRSPTYIPAMACSVASEILGHHAPMGTGSLHYAEVSAWARGPAAHEDFEAQLMNDVQALHRALDIDVVRMPWRMNAKPSRQLDELTFLFGDPDRDHSIWKYDPDSADFGVIKRVVTQPPDEGELQRSVESQEFELQRTAGETPSVPAEYQRLFDRFGGEFFTVCSGGGVGIGMDEADLTALVLEPDLVRRRMMVYAEYAIRLGTSLVGSECPWVMLGGGDLAGVQGPIFSPRSFREVLLPAYQRMLGRLNALGAHYVFRSDGNLWSLADMLFGEAACPGYGEVDRDATMTIASLRLRFPRLVIWGNMSSGFLQHATADQVREEGRRLVEESGGTRYFHGCSNAIVTGTPSANVEAMFSVR